MHKLNWKKATGNFSLEHHFSVFVLSLFACLLFPLYLLENGISTYAVLVLIAFLLAIAVSWISIKKAHHNEKVALTAFFLSKKVYLEIFLLILLGSMLLLNVALSHAIKQLALGQHEATIPYLAFAVFCFKKWWVRFAYVMVIFIAGLLLSALNALPI